MFCSRPACPSSHWEELNLKSMGPFSSSRWPTPTPILPGLSCCTQDATTWESQRGTCACPVTQSCPALCDPWWTAAHQAPQSIGFSRQNCRSELPGPPPWDLPDPGIEPRFPALQVDSLQLSHQRSLIKRQ